MTELRYLGHDKRYKDDAHGNLGYSRLGDWRDTLNVPPLANITVIIDCFPVHSITYTDMVHEKRRRKKITNENIGDHTAAYFVHDLYKYGIQRIFRLT